MKKIFSFAIVLVAAALVSCGGNPTKPAAAEAEAAAQTEVVADSTACCGKCDSTACEKCDPAACEKCDSETCEKKAEGECCKK